MTTSKIIQQISGRPNIDEIERLVVRPHANEVIVSNE